MAHDFDNILMGVMGFAELAQSALESDSPAANFLHELLRVAQRGLAATRQMHQFSRGGRVVPQPARVEDVWQSDRTFRTESLPPGTRVGADWPDDLPPVAVAAEPLRVVLRALVQNAAEASLAGATVGVRARAVSLAAPLTHALPAGVGPGEYVELTVTDRGPGFRPVPYPARPRRWPADRKRNGRDGRPRVPAHRRRSPAGAGAFSHPRRLPGGVLR
jgi:signal transduction histidine kinase